MTKLLYIYIKFTSKGTELLFAGFFNDMEPAEIASVLSSLVYDEKTSTER